MRAIAVVSSVRIADVFLAPWEGVRWTAAARGDHVRRVAHKLGNVPTAPAASQRLA